MSVKDEWNMACPKCKRDTHIQIVITTFAELTEFGTEDVGDHEWDDDSVCRCSHCAFVGTVKDFTLPEGDA